MLKSNIPMGKYYIIYSGYKTSRFKFIYNVNISNPNIMKLKLNLFDYILKYYYIIPVTYVDNLFFFIKNKLDLIGFISLGTLIIIYITTVISITLLISKKDMKKLISSHSNKEDHKEYLLKILLSTGSIVGVIIGILNLVYVGSNSELFYYNQLQEYLITFSIFVLIILLFTTPSVFLYQFSRTYRILINKQCSRVYKILEALQYIIEYNLIYSVSYLLLYIFYFNKIYASLFDTNYLVTGNFLQKIYDLFYIPLFNPDKNCYTLFISNQLTYIIFVTFLIIIPMSIISVGFVYYKIASSEQ